MIQKGRKSSGSRGAGVQRRDKNGGEDGGAKAATPGLRPGEPQRDKIPKQGSVEALGGTRNRTRRVNSLVLASRVPRT